MLSRTQWNEIVCVLGVRQIEKFDNRLNIVTMGNYNLHCSDYIIRIRGLPWNTSTKEILDFFDGLNIVNGENGIHLISLATNTTKPLGEAFIELATVYDFQASQRYHKKNLRNRYIEGKYERKLLYHYN